MPTGAECSRYKSIESSAPKRPLSRLQAPRLAPGADGNVFVVNTVVNTGPQWAIQPLATRAEAWQAIPGVSRESKTRLLTAIHSKTPALQRRGSHLCSEQRLTRPALRGDDFAG